MKTLGLDASSKITGYGILSETGNLYDHGIIDLHKETNSYDRIKQMINNIFVLIKSTKPDLIYIEEMWNKQNVQTTKYLSYIIGSTIGFGEILKIPVYLVLPSEWRKLCGFQQGKRKREELKKEAIQFVKNKFHIDVLDDEAEGICIAYCGYLSQYSEDLTQLFE